MTLREKAADEGFSVAELLVASFIGLLALGAAYLLFETGMKGFRQVETTTLATRAAADSMTAVDRPARELQQIQVAEDYRLRFLSDPDDDGVLEQVTIYIPEGSTRLMLDKPDPSGIGTVTATIADIVRNRALGVPLFSYYSSVGTLVSSEASRPAGTKILRITVVTRAESTPTPPPYRVQTDIFLRNRK